MPLTDSARVVFSLFAAASITAAIHAQGAGQDPGQEVEITTEQGQEWKFTIGGGAEYQFKTNLGSSDFSLARYGGALGAQTDLTRDLSMSLFASYALDLYDFDPGALGVAPPAEPWDSIHTFTAAAIFSLDLANDWGAFGGPVFQSARESNADFGDSITAGGVFGLTYTASRDLTIGGGIGVMSELEDDARIFPIIIVDWHINNDWRLRNTSTVNAANRTGIELIFHANDNWEFALGGASQYSRFRLDDVAPAPDGIGEDSSLPFWFRASYMPSQQLKVDAILGVNTSGELDLANSSGTGIASNNYDAAFFIGVFGTFRF